MNTNESVLLNVYFQPPDLKTEDEGTSACLNIHGICLPLRNVRCFFHSLPEDTSGCTPNFYPGQRVCVASDAFMVLIQRSALDGVNIFSEGFESRNAFYLIRDMIQTYVMYMIFFNAPIQHSCLNRHDKYWCFEGTFPFLATSICIQIRWPNFLRAATEKWKKALLMGSAVDVLSNRYCENIYLTVQKHTSSVVTRCWKGIRLHQGQEWDAILPRNELKISLFVLKTWTIKMLHVAFVFDCTVTWK